MTDASFQPSLDPAAPSISIEAILRAELSQGDALISTIVPIMHHLVSNDDHSVFSEEIVARTRGMIEDVARQLLIARAERASEDSARSPSRELVSVMVAGLSADRALLAHVHSLALEWQLTDRLHARLGLDPVLSPLLQALIASTDNTTAALAMNLLAAQARFTQSQRRMQLPLGELPADQLHAALVALRGVVGANAPAMDQTEREICVNFDESRGRLGLMSRLVLGMGGGATAALSVEHAGVGLFLSALAIANGHPRELAVLATNEAQVARLALGLAAAGLKAAAIAEQFLLIHPDITLPEGFEHLGADRSAALLALGAGYPA